MNKEEAIKELQNQARHHCGEIECYKDGCEKSVELSKAINIVSCIDEPQMVVVPKFVAEWIEKHKKSFQDSSAIDMYENLTLDNRNGYYHEVWLWVIDNNYDFIKAWHEGYDIEPEKLYTVEIPNPKNIGAERTVLMKNGFNQIVMINVYDDDWRTIKGYQLTESEIKEDFEWAWQFANEVE